MKGTFVANDCGCMPIQNTENHCQLLSSEFILYTFYLYFKICNSNIRHFDHFNLDKYYKYHILIPRLLGIPLNRNFIIGLFLYISIGSNLYFLPLRSAKSETVLIGHMVHQVLGLKIHASKSPKTVVVSIIEYIL